MWLLAECVLLLLTTAGALEAQSGQSPFVPTSGSVPATTAETEVRHLTLHDAIDMGMRYNLGVIEGEENNRAARAQRLRALSDLLPQVSAEVSENGMQSSRAALGIMASSIPAVIGPFSYSTVQATVNQILFSLESIQRLRAARTEEQVVSLTYADTLDIVTVTIGNAYLRIIEADSRVAATEARVRNAQALYDQAVAAFEAGTSPRIDVTRTSVQLHTERYNLSVARNTLAIVKLNLSRAIGLPLGQSFDLADRVPYADLGSQSVDDALRAAYSSRSDLRAAVQSVESAEHQLAAARAERYPTLAVSGAYGQQGTTFFRPGSVFSLLANVRVPLFTGGRIESDLTQADATLRLRQAEAENLRGQVDYDVRAALLNLQSAKEQAALARENVDLANENLARSRERFAAGVADSVEVVQAQQSLSSADDQYVSSVYRHNLAKLQLARALGVARKGYGHYLAVR